MAFLLDTSILVRLANMDDVQNPVAVRADKLATRLFFPCYGIQVFVYH